MPPHPADADHRYFNSFSPDVFLGFMLIFRGRAAARAGSLATPAKDLEGHGFHGASSLADPNTWAANCG